MRKSEKLLLLMLLGTKLCLRTILASFEKLWTCLVIPQTSGVVSEIYLLFFNDGKNVMARVPTEQKYRVK